MSTHFSKSSVGTSAEMSSRGLHMARMAPWGTVVEAADIALVVVVVVVLNNGRSLCYYAVGFDHFLSPKRTTNRAVRFRQIISLVLQVFL